MRKRIFGRRLKRDRNERNALFKNLMSALIIYERIQTTEQKAKAVKGSVEKLITRARDEGEKGKTLLSPYLTSDALKKLLSDVAPRFKGRPGGYTRIIRLSKRLSDKASMVVLELVETSKVVAVAHSVKPNVGKVEKVEKVEKGKPEKTQARKRSARKTKDAKSSKTR